jgi:hypothetical protein
VSLQPLKFNLTDNGKEEHQTMSSPKAANCDDNHSISSTEHSVEAENAYPEPTFAAQPWKYLVKRVTKSRTGLEQVLGIDKNCVWGSGGLGGF